MILSERRQSDKATCYGESVFKKKCTENLSSSYHRSPIFVGSQSSELSLALTQSPSVTAIKPVLNSPTSALARLNFNHLSPLTETPSPTADGNAFSNGAVSVAVAFTMPCHTIGVGEECRMSSSVVTVQLGPKHCGIKRPLDGLSTPPTGSADSQDNVSHKRPLARPNSIAFSAPPAKSSPSPDVALPFSWSVATATSCRMDAATYKLAANEPWRPSEEPRDTSVVEKIFICDRPENHIDSSMEVSSHSVMNDGSRQESANRLRFVAYI